MTKAEIMAVRMITIQRDLENGCRNNVQSIPLVKGVTILLTLTVWKRLKSQCGNFRILYEINLEELRSSKTVVLCRKVLGSEYSEFGKLQPSKNVEIHENHF